MDQREDQTVDETVADETLSPSVTEGASSSDAADQEVESLADAMAREFAEKFGDAEPGSEETEEGEAADAGDAPVEPASEQKPDETEERDDPEDDEHHIPDEVFKSLSPGVKKRIGHLNTRAKRAERELTQAKERMPALEDAHQRFTQIQTFVQDNNIEPENVTKMFNMAAMMAKGDFEGFLREIKPFYDHAAQAAGQIIPDDLRKQVDEGYLTEDHARELTRARAQSQNYQAQAQRATQQAQQFQSQQAQVTQQQQMVSAIQAREAELKSQDPDYAQKQPMLMTMVRIALENGARPQTTEQAIKMVNDAYAAVGQMAPKPKPTATPPRPGASSPPRGAPAPQSSREAIEQALLGLA